MAESVTKGIGSLELDDRDADDRKTRCSISTDISVEGFDTSLQNFAARLTLIKHFASCGKVLAVSVINSVAFMRIKGEDAKEKALALSGTDVGGWIPIVKAAPWQREPYEPYDASKKEGRMFVSGYDTCLTEIDIQIAVCKRFSSCGEIISITVLPTRGRALVIMRGESCVDKALKLSGLVGGMNLVVNPNTLKPPNSGKRVWADYRPIGYSPPEYVLELKKRKEEEKEKRKEEEKQKEKEKKMKKKMEKKMKKKIKKALY